MYHTEKPNLTETPNTRPEAKLVESPDYLRGYKDGLRDGAKKPRRFSGDGILGALLAIALLSGLGYLAWNYMQTGSFLPFQVELRTPVEITTPRSETGN